MLFIWISLWFVTAMLLITDFRSRETRWLAAFTFIVGTGGMGTFLRDNLPALVHDPFWHDRVQALYSFARALSHNVGPYAYLIYAISASSLFRTKFVTFSRQAPKLLLAPVVLMYLLFPIVPEYEPSFLILSLWAVPYSLFANFLLIHSWVQEKNPRIGQYKFLICLIVTPITTFSMLANYLLRIFNIQIWHYNGYALFISIMTFLIFSIRYGVMGVHLKLEQNRLENTMRAFSSGAAILNHTIKNEVLKLALCNDNIRRAIENNRDIRKLQESILEDTDIISCSITHLLEMAKRIHGQLHTITLQENWHSLNDMLDHSILMLTPEIREKKILIKKEYTEQFRLWCDRIHITEMLINIYKNALDALPEGGTISIEIYISKKYATLMISDSGRGIPKNDLPFVIEPFFSTKKTNENFGLGLAYCYNVMHKHGGSLEIVSQENIGTTVYLNFQKKYFTVNLAPLSGESQYDEKYQDSACR